MWRCEWCKAEFEEPETSPSIDPIDRNAWYGPMVHEVCPECGSEFIEEIEENDE